MLRTLPGPGEAVERLVAFPGKGGIREGSREEVAMELILKNEQGKPGREGVGRAF